MSVEKEIRTRILSDAVKLIVGARVFFGRAPDTAEKPLVIFYRIACRKTYVQDGEDGLPDFRFDILCIADDCDTAKSLGEKVAALFAAHKGTKISVCFTENEDLDIDPAGNAWVYTISCRALVTA